MPNTNEQYVDKSSHTNLKLSHFHSGQRGQLKAALQEEEMRVIDITTATYTVDKETGNNNIFTLNRAAGIAITLPEAEAGLHFTFIVETTFTGAATIKSALSADIMIGNAVMGNDSDNTVVRWPALASSTYDTISMFGTANSTGGIEGQIIDIIGLDKNKWFVQINGDAAGTEATPFQNTVS